MLFLRNLAVFLLVVVGGFVVVKVADAYIDVNGIEADIAGLTGDLLVECIGDPYCEDDIIDQIETIRTHNNRDVVLDYETLDYAAASNMIMLEGSKTIDFLVTKYTYRFSINAEVWR